MSIAKPTEMEVDELEKNNGQIFQNDQIKIKQENVDNDGDFNFIDETEAKSNHEDDPVVSEIPVFLAKTLAQQLYLFQYPVRPCTLPNDPETTSVMDSRIKPNQQKVELTIGLNASCPNYDKSKGEQIALNVDGSTSNQKSDDEITYGRGIMDRITLSSQKSVKDPSRYAVGIFNGSELHITPLKGIVNLKPTMNYLDKSDRTAKAEGRPRLVESSQDEDEDDAKPEAEVIQKVGVKFLKGKAENDKSLEMKKKSFEYQQKLAEEEAWVPTDYYHNKSEKWIEQSQKLFCKHLDGEAVGGDVKVDEYLEQLRE